MTAQSEGPRTPQLPDLGAFAALAAAIGWVYLDGPLSWASYHGQGVPATAHIDGSGTSRAGWSGTGTVTVGGRVLRDVSIEGFDNASAPAGADVPVMFLENFPGGTDAYRPHHSDILFTAGMAALGVVSLVYVVWATARWWLARRRGGDAAPLSSSEVDGPPASPDRER